jgi:acyl carrier protein
MTNQEFLLERTESYVKGLISELSNSLTPDFDSLAPFGELGLDSFHVLKIIKALEADFGTLPKTLLFENFNVGDLARYFVTEHAQTLSAKLAKDLRTASDRTGPQQLRPVAVPSKSAAEPIGATSRPILMLEKDAYAHPELGESVRKIFDRYKNDGSVSRGTRVIAPNLFIGSEKRGFFNYSRSKNVILAYAYTGPQDYFFTLAQELYQHCDRHAFELNLLTGDELKSIGDVRLSSTPFGVLQRSVNLQNFAGRASHAPPALPGIKFGKSGDCRTEVPLRLGPADEP